MNSSTSSSSPDIFDLRLLTEIVSRSMSSSSSSTDVTPASCSSRCHGNRNAHHWRKIALKWQGVTTHCYFQSIVIVWYYLQSIVIVWFYLQSIVIVWNYLQFIVWFYLRFIVWYYLRFIVIVWYYLQVYYLFILSSVHSNEHKAKGL